MEEKNKAYLILALFVFLAVFAVIFILKREKENDFEINREEATTEEGTAVPEKNSGSGTKETDEEYFNEEMPQEEPEKETNYSPLVEKYKGKEIIKVNTEEKAVALTFDAGANADGVEPVLAILKENGIRGTFFLTGKFIEKFPEKVKKIMASGGDVGNHTYDHPYLSQLSSEQIKEEIAGSEKAFAKLGGKFQPLLRAPYGDRNQTVLNAVSEAGYINIRWTVDSLGWKGTSGGQTKNSVRDKVLQNASPGAIIMMHLGSNPDDKTHLDSAALPEIIEQLRADGYEFVTLSELIGMEK
jgi:peptidoglycan/xylan/chitin deacetylase (PgdA/CDA1 family)